ncbi:MAG: hypothetical protein AB7F78_02655 [Hyphomicrobiaceae bacterium]
MNAIRSAPLPRTLTITEIDAVAGAGPALVTQLPGIQLSSSLLGRIAALRATLHEAMPQL